VEDRGDVMSFAGQVVVVKVVVVGDGQINKVSAVPAQLKRRAGHCLQEQASAKTSASGIKSCDRLDCLAIITCGNPLTN
jgi:hypothetical protein